jgi:hypothetical protein
MNTTPEAGRRLRNAVKSVEVPPFLEARILSRIRAEGSPRRWMPRLLSATTAAALCGGVLIAWQLGHLRLTVGAQDAYISSVSTQVATLMRVGLGDHIHCAVFRKYPENPPTTEEFVRDMNPRYAGLIPIVRSHVPTIYRMTLAHECQYQGRKFVHLSLRDDSNLLSLLITRKSESESFRAQNMLPALVQSGIPMYQAGVQRFRMTAFETRDYLVYFISDLSGEKNTETMLAVAPEVKAFLAGLES